MAWWATYIRVDELALAGDVAVVGAGVGAGADQRLAAADVGADGRDDHLGPGREVGQGGGVIGVGHDQLDVGADLGPDLLQLVEAAAGEGPAQAVGAVASEVLGGQCAGEARRAEEDDVELAAVGPGGIASSWQVRNQRAASRPSYTRAPARPDRTRRRRRRRPRRRLRGGGRLRVPDADDHLADRPPARSGQRPPAGQRRPPARAASCDELLEWYVDHGVDRVTPYGWDYLRVYTLEDNAAGSPEPAGRPRADRRRRSSETGTNVQEAGVDEPDVVKTDGSLLVRVVDDSTPRGVRRHGRRARAARVARRSTGCSPPSSCSPATASS